MVNVLLGELNEGNGYVRTTERMWKNVTKRDKEKRRQERIENRKKEGEREKSKKNSLSVVILGFFLVQRLASSDFQRKKKQKQARGIRKRTFTFFSFNILLEKEIEVFQILLQSIQLQVGWYYVSEQDPQEQIIFELTKANPILQTVANVIFHCVGAEAAQVRSKKNERKKKVKTKREEEKNRRSEKRKGRKGRKRKKRAKPKRKEDKR